MCNSGGEGTATSVGSSDRTMASAVSEHGIQSVGGLHVGEHRSSRSAEPRGVAVAEPGSACDVRSVGGLHVGEHRSSRSAEPRGVAVAEPGSARDARSVGGLHVGEHRSSRSAASCGWSFGESPGWSCFQVVDAVCG